MSARVMNRWQGSVKSESRNAAAAIGRSDLMYEIAAERVLPLQPGGGFAIPSAQRVTLCYPRQSHRTALA
jgi:hypothetical protein